ncbi:MAG: enoyl-CoA hydratase [Paracoccaceae bacterium]
MAILIRQDAHGVARLTMNAPERLNAMSDEMIAAFDHEFSRLAKDRSIRAIIISGHGKAFCAGHDLKQMTAARQSDDGGAAYFTDLFARYAALMQAIPRLPQPVIAQVHGIATAAGCQLVATCDMAVAATGTRFGVNGVNIGLFCSSPMVALSRNLPRKQAFELLTTGEFISADRALELGLVNRVVPPNELAETTMALAAKVAAKLGSAVRVGKQAFYQQAQMPLDQAYAFAGNVMAQNMLNSDTAEGISAFLEKREATWKNDGC